MKLSAAQIKALQAMAAYEATHPKTRGCDVGRVVPAASVKALVRLGLATTATRESVAVKRGDTCCVTLTIAKLTPAGHAALEIVTAAA